MDELLSGLRAAAEPTRLRLLALVARGAICVVEFTESSASRSLACPRHLKLLCEAGLLERLREGANAWFGLAGGEGGALVRAILSQLPETTRSGHRSPPGRRGPG